MSGLSSELHAAEALLDYPEVSIPGVNKLYIMIYGKRHEGDIPVKKYILLVRAAADGMFFIDSKENNKTKKTDVRKTPEAMGAVDGDKQLPTMGPGSAPPVPEPKKGYFTAMVELRKSNKRKPSGRPKTDKPEGGA
ncbi:MAG: hypothetical protein EB060_06215 [Proteobacteria bacterium]|nr:hypothetical protein [Pseudomonadota bacterium]